MTANGSPLDDFSLLNRDAMRDTENISLDQRLLVADAHRQIREERDKESGESEHEDGGDDQEDSGSSELSNPVLNRRVSRGNFRGKRVHPQDCSPTCYHPGGIFEELPALSLHMMRDLRHEGQSWRNMFGSFSTHSSVRKLPRECRGRSDVYHPHERGASVVSAGRLPVRLQVFLSEGYEALVPDTSANNLLYVSSRSCD
ncbi:hypothetical protein Bca101_059248 [Brassica carinata]